MDAGLLQRRIYVQRYSTLQRVNHWITAILFVLLALSGLGLFYPDLFWLTFLFGGGESAKAIHPWLGCALLVSFFVLAVQFVRNNIPNGDDLKWMRSLHTVMANSHEKLPELGKYNAGQKAVYWSQFFLIPILFVTGILVWQIYFGEAVPIWLQRLSLLIHCLAAAIAITVIIVHVYAGIWVKGTPRAMTRGTVTGGWAYLHHRKWLRESIAKGLVRSGPGPHGDE